MRESCVCELSRMVATRAQVEERNFVADSRKFNLSARIGTDNAPSGANSLGAERVDHRRECRGDSIRPKRLKTTRAPLIKWRLKRAIEFIETNIDRPLLLEDLARAAGLSRMYFAAQFREAMGVTPHSYLLWCRIEKSKRMLESTNVPIVEVALATGFSNQAHFTVVFKRFAGMTPLQWRRQNPAPNSLPVPEIPIMSG